MTDSQHKENTAGRIQANTDSAARELDEQYRPGFADWSSVG